jgi:glycosyltransferase involved in cell wall biosynthesis
VKTAISTLHRRSSLLLDDCHQRLGRVHLDGEVIVVDNGSTDGSAEVAAAAGARVIAEPRRDYGRALRSGFERANADVVVMADADGTYDLSRLPQLVRPVLDGDADMALATRLDGATRASMPLLHRHLGTPVITFLTSRACGRKVTCDSQTGYRAFRRDRMLELGLRSDGMELASEMLIKAAAAASGSGTSRAATPRGSASPSSTPGPMGGGTCS